MDGCVERRTLPGKHGGAKTMDVEDIHADDQAIFDKYHGPAGLFLGGGPVS